MNLERFGQEYLASRKERNLMRWGLHRRADLVCRHIKDGSFVLDVGAADGAMLRLIAPRKQLKNFVNLEANPDLAKAISENAICASGLKLPFADGVFDHVICSATRKHVADSVGLTREMGRVLKVGGQVIILDPHPFLLWLGRALGKFDPRYLRHFSFANDICADFEKAGLRPTFRRNGIFVCCVGEKLEASSGSS